MFHGRDFFQNERDRCFLHLLASWFSKPFCCFILRLGASLLGQWGRGEPAGECACLCNLLFLVWYQVEVQGTTTVLSWAHFPPPTENVKQLYQHQSRQTHRLNSHRWSRCLREHPPAGPRDWGVPWCLAHRCQLWWLCGLCPPHTARTSLSYSQDRASVTYGISADLLRLGKNARSTMCLCVYIHIDMCIWIDVYAYVYTHTSVHMCTHI